MNFLRWRASRARNRRSSDGSKWSKIFSCFGKPADNDPRAVTPAPPESEHQAKADVSGTTDTPRQRCAPAAEESPFIGVPRQAQEMRGSVAPTRHDSRGTSPTTAWLCVNTPRHARAAARSHRCAPAEARSNNQLRDCNRAYYSESSYIKQT